MNENIYQLFRDRIVNLARGSFPDIYPDSVKMKAEYARTEHPVPFKDRLSLSYVPVSEGMCWGREWDSAWFHVTAEVPKPFAGRELCLRLNTESEILLFDAGGVPLFGLTERSVFDTTFCKERFDLGRKKPGEKIDFWFEASANGLFGIDLQEAEARDPEHPNGSLSPVVHSLRLCVFDRELWLFLLEMETLSNLLLTLGQKDWRGKQLFHALTKAVDLYNYNPANAGAARALLRETVFSRKAEDGALTAYTIGHAHIDVGWLWPVRESTRKAARTFSSQIALMKEYPDYKFGASQAYLYEQVKENYPELYRKVRKAVREKRWEIQGGMYVEADGNLISGESMVRQFLYGKNFFMDEFGVDVRNLWLPDVFGYSAAMPQIIRRSGCRFFLTQKLCWCQVNKFPYHTFRWIGVDGSEVLTHFPPEDTYNANPDAANRIYAADQFNEAGFLPGFISLVGIGDGGGGPSDNYVERNRILGDLRSCPKAEWRFASDFFDSLVPFRDELPVWSGELYFELHRGTLTSQSRTKRGNRKCEQILTAWEKLASCLPAREWPRRKLAKAWKTLLVNQFHDILPGSSIGLVYERTEKEHAEILSLAAREIRSVCAKLFRENGKSAVLVNTLSTPWTGLVELPESWNGFSAVDEEGNLLPAQKADGKTFVLVTVPGERFLTVSKRKKTPVPAADTKTFLLENDRIRYEFTGDGRLIHAWDKELQKEFLDGEGNVLSLYHDRPQHYEAWDVDIYYPHDAKGSPECVSARTAHRGPAGSFAEFVYRTGKSEIRQTVVLAEGSKRLDFITHVDWHETRTMLRTSFPVRIRSDKASFDIQYACLERPTHNNTSWDQAKFEVCGQRYADLSDSCAGAALLNDCKYGYCVKGSTLDLALLRSPNHPDWFADQGAHAFTYSFLPHGGTLMESDVLIQAASLNRDILFLDGFEAGGAGPFCSVDSDAVSLEVVKRAEKDDSRILRLVETHGKTSRGILRFASKPVKVSETDLVEWEKGDALPVRGNTLEISLDPFEIKTIRVE